MMQKAGAWGGHLELTALSRRYSVNVVLHQLGQAPYCLIQTGDGLPTIELAFHDTHTGAAGGFRFSSRRS